MLAAALLLGANPTEPAPLADGELGLAEQLGDLVRGVPVLVRPLLYQHLQL